MTSYLPGRYRFNAATRTWMSGRRTGAFVPVPASSTAAAMAGGRLWVPPLAVVPPVSYVRPTGPGYYAIEDMGVGTDLRAAEAATYAAGGPTAVLTLPIGLITLPNFVHNGNNQALVSRVGIVGSGPGTVISPEPNSIVGMSTTPNVIRFTSTAKEIRQFTLQGTQQNLSGYGKVDYSGIMLARINGVHFADVTVEGNNGSLNSPLNGDKARIVGGVKMDGQGETFGVNMFYCTNALVERVQTDGRDTSGAKQSGSGLGTNNCTTVVMHDCTFNYSGHGHGLAIYRCEDVTTYDTEALNNGQTGGTATNGSLGDGLNCEESWNTKHYRPRLGGNTLATVRYYAKTAGASGSTPQGPPNGGTSNYGGDTSPHLLDSLTMVDGQPFIIRMGNVQKAPPTLVNCPTPSYVYAAT